MKLARCERLRFGILLVIAAITSASASAMDRIEGRVVIDAKPIAKADVAVWMAGPDAPQKLAETQSQDDGRFELTIAEGKDREGVLYVTAKAPNPSITMLATLGTIPKQRITINELTTVASVWTGAQFLNGMALRGNMLGLITDVEIDPAGNVWVANNWNRPDEGFKKEPDEALSTRFGGNGAVVFFGLAKPVRSPLIGPVQAW